MAEAKLTAVISAKASAFFRTMTRVRKAAKAVGGALIRSGAVAIAGAAVGWAKAVSEVSSYGDAVGKMAKRTGFSTDAIQRLQFAAELSGASLGGVEKSIAKMSTSINEARKGTATYTHAFGQMKMSAEDFKNLSPEESFKKIMVGLSGLDDAGTRSAVAIQLLGKGGRQLLPMLEDGAAGFRKLTGAADEMGILMTPAQIQAAEDFKDAMLKAKSSVTAIVRQNVAGAMEPLTEIFEDMATNGAFDSLGEGVKSISDEFVKASQEMAKFLQNEENVAALLVTLKAVAQVIGGVAKLAVMAAAAFGFMSQKVSTMAEGITGAVVDPMNKSGQGGLLAGARSVTDNMDVVGPTGAMFGAAGNKILDVLSTLLVVTEDRLPATGGA